MRILGYILVVLFVTTSAFGQQINPVPDYIFRNQMSVGRNAPTDTAAYLSVGPRYGANKGLMPPMVVDTNAVTGVKRNGLLIFSVQLNNFAYWDSTTSRFRKITAEAVVDSVVFATRAWRKKGDDSLGAVISQRTDTALLSTKAYRQKGVDSLVTLISTLGGGTVLSVSAGTGMNFTTITTSGSVNADTNVLATRANRDKLKDSLQANIAGKVNISDTSTMLSAYLRRADTTSMLSPYLRKTDTTAMLTPYVRTAGFGLTKGTQTLSVDSALMATRARVQKGIDSVASLVTTTDSVVFSTRAWRQKGVDSVAALANTKATATGTTNYLSKFTGTSSLGNSIVYATTSEVGISTPSPTHPLDVNGRVRVRTIDSTATGMNMLYADVDGVIKKAAVPAGGTVTSVAAGTGMSFTTITTTGSVSADTVALATRAWRQKGIDSVANVRIGGSGTAAYIPKFSAARTLANSNIVDNGQTVQIGTTTGSGAFFIRNDTAVTATLAALGTYGAKLDFNNIGVDNFRIAMPPSTGALGFYSSATTERMRLTSAGDLGIGTTSPADKVDINGSLRIRANTPSFTAVQGGVIDFVPTSIFPTTPSMRIFSIGDASNNGLITFGTGTTGTAAERMRLTGAGRLLVGTTTEGTNTVDIAGTLRSTQGANFATSSGNVGIGTESPSSKLNVIGTKTTALTTAADFLTLGLTVDDNTAYDNAGVGGGIAFRGRRNIAGTLTVYGAIDVAKETNLIDEYGGSIRFWNNQNSTGIPLERMRLTSAGRLGIGTTSPSEALHVVGRGRFSTIDSTSSPINLLTSDVNGVIRKTAVPASVAGSGNTNYIPKWTNATALGNSVMYEQGGEITVGSTTDYGAFTLQVDGTQYVKTSLAVGTTSLLADADVQIGATSGNDGYLQIAAASNGIAQISFGDGSGNDRFAGYMQYYHSGDSLIIGTASAPRFNLNATGLGLGTAPAERLDVNGRARVRTIDSSGSPINMLWADNNGVIRKAAVPAGGGGGVTSVATGFGIDGGTITSTGTLTADTVEMATRARVQKGIDSVGALARVTGSGTTNYVPLWTGSTALGNSSIYEASSEVLIGTTSDAGAFKLQVNGDSYLNGFLYNTGNIRNGGKIYLTSNVDENTAFENNALTIGYNSTDSAGWIQAKALSYSGARLYLNAEGGKVMVGTNADYGSYVLQVNGVGYLDGGLRTGSGTGVTPATWKLGSKVNTTGLVVSSTEYIEVNIAGSSYRIAIVN